MKRFKIENSKLKVLFVGISLLYALPGFSQKMTEAEALNAAL